MRQVPFALSLASLLGTISLWPTTAAADTVLNFSLGSGSVLAGNATTPPTAFCATSSGCPGTPTYGLSSNDPLTGTVSFDLTTDTMSFNLTLSQNATLGPIVLDAGSSFVGTSVWVDYSSTTSKKGVTTYDFSPGTGTQPPGTTTSVTANLIPGSSFTVNDNQPAIPGIECSATSSGSGSCSLTIGTSLPGANSLEVTTGGTGYNGVMSISANLVTPVPLPASGLLLVVGLTPLLAAAKRRALH